MPVDQSFNVYREQLTSKYHGIALWHPNPVKRLYDCGHISIGDVGYLQEGIFIRIFNVTLPWDDPSNEKLGKPDKYEPLEQGHFVNVRDIEFQEAEYRSPHVAKVENSENFQAVTPEESRGRTYTCKSRSRGALLSLPYGGLRTDVIRTKAFEGYIRDNAFNWFNWAQRNGLGVERIEDLILVTGCTLVRAWAAAAFDDYTMPADSTAISLDVQKDDLGRAQFIWSNIRGNVEYHNSHFDPSVENPLPLNQCVFIRGFRTKRKFFSRFGYGFRVSHATGEPLPYNPGNSRTSSTAKNTMPNSPAQNRALHQVSKPYAFAHPSSFPTRPGSPVLISSRSGGSPTAENHALLLIDEELTKPRQLVSIDTLPDDALLVIFDHHLYGVRQEVYQRDQRVEKAWLSLVHVCHRWRSIVFESPCRLDLGLLCTGRTRARDRLDVWPTLPLIIAVNIGDSIRNVDNITAALERTDRVCQIYLLHVESWDMEMILAAMQQPFPQLTNLRLWSNDETVPVPDSFLGGSTPRLEYLALNRIPFPDLPKLLLSATQLVTLHLGSIPHSGYFPPDAIATSLSTLTSLNYLALTFLSPLSCPNQESPRLPPSSTRPVLPHQEKPTLINLLSGQ